jgi:hypothetical protein
MTLAEIKASVRGLLTDDQYDEDLIAEAANWFVYELFNNTRTRLMESSDTITTSINDTTADFPSDMMTWISIYRTVPDVAPITEEYLQYEEFMRRHANFATATAARQADWTMFGNAMRFAAPLSVAHTFQIDYLREPVAMEDDSDDCEVPDRYSELVSKGTLARIMEINEDYAEAAQERTNMEPLVNAFIRNEARGGGKTGPIIMNSRRRRGNSTGVPRLGE